MCTFAENVNLAMDNRIKEVIQEKGYTITSLAEKLGMARESLSRIIINPSSPTLEKLSEALDVPVWQFFTTKAEVVGGSDLVAFIRSKGQLYEANSVEELEALVGQMKKGE